MSEKLYYYGIETYNGERFETAESVPPEEMMMQISKCDDEDWFVFSAIDPDNRELYSLAYRIGDIRSIEWNGQGEGPIDPRCDCGQPLDCPEDEYVE